MYAALVFGGSRSMADTLRVAQVPVQMRRRCGRLGSVRCFRKGDDVWTF